MQQPGTGGSNVNLSDSVGKDNVDVSGLSLMEGIVDGANTNE